MNEHDVLKKNHNFYIGVIGTVLEGLLSGSLFMLLYSVMQFLWSGQFDMNRVLVLTCVIAVVFLLRILIYSYPYDRKDEAPVVCCNTPPAGRESA